MKAFKLTQIILMIISSFNLSVFAQTEQNEVKEKIKLQILTKTDTIALKNLNILRLLKNRFLTVCHSREGGNLLNNQ